MATVVGLVAAAALATGAAPGDSSTIGLEANRPDRRAPSIPGNLRVVPSGQHFALTWGAAVDNVGVAGYDGRVGKMRVRVTSPRVSLRAVPCGPLPVRIVAVDEASNRSKAATASIRTPMCRGAKPRPVWSGDFDNGDVSQWDFIHRYTLERFIAVRSDGDVVPRSGPYMARVEVRPNEPASWSASSNVSLAEKSTLNVIGELGDDSYVGFSIYLPDSFSPVPNQLANNIFEWHGDTNEVQASVHLLVDTIRGRHYGIVNAVPGFVMDLNTEPGYNPVMFRFGDLVTGRWVDFVIRVRWATDATGIVEGWMDGVRKVRSVRKTWYSDGQISHVKPQLGYYRANYTKSSVLYVDAFRVGTSYEAVAP